jgi:hypothetical protein
VNQKARNKKKKKRNFPVMLQSKFTFYKRTAERKGVWMAAKEASESIKNISLEIG